MKKIFLIFMFISSVCYAQSSWSTPIDLSAAGQAADNSQLAIDGNNKVIAVWTIFNGTNFIIQSSTSADPASSWSAPVDISAGESVNPQLAIDGNNNVISVWTRFDGTNLRIQSSASADSGSTWSAPVNLSAAGQDANLPQLAIDGNNNVIAVWQRSDGTKTIIQSSTSADSGSSWSAPVNLSAAGQNAALPQLAIDGNNNVIAVWQRSDGTNTIIQSSTSADSGSTWSAPADISDAGGNAVNPQLAIDGNNNVIAVWRRFDGTNTRIQSSTSADSGSTWSTPLDLSDAGQDADQPQLAIDGNNNVIAVWQRSDGTNTIIQSSTSADSGSSWSTRLDLSAAGQDAATPQLAIDGNNNVIAVWQRSDGTNTIIQSSTSADPASTWSTPIDLSAAGGAAINPQLAIDGNNNVIAVWTRFDGTSNIIQSSALLSPVSPVSSFNIIFIR
jgi:hypothetical protein